MTLKKIINTLIFLYFGIGTASADSVFDVRIPNLEREYHIRSLCVQTNVNLILELHEKGERRILQPRVVYGKFACKVDAIENLFEVYFSNTDLIWKFNKIENTLFVSEYSDDANRSFYNLKIEVFQPDLDGSQSINDAVRSLILYRNQPEIAAYFKDPDYELVLYPFDFIGKIEAHRDEGCLNNVKLNVEGIKDIKSLMKRLFRTYAVKGSVFKLFKSGSGERSGILYFYSHGIYKNEFIDMSYIEQIQRLKYNQYSSKISYNDFLNSISFGIMNNEDRTINDIRSSQLFYNEDIDFITKRHVWRRLFENGGDRTKSFLLDIYMNWKHSSKQEMLIWLPSVGDIGTTADNKLREIFGYEENVKIRNEILNEISQNSPVFVEFKNCHYDQGKIEEDNKDSLNRSEAKKRMECHTVNFSLLAIIGLAGLLFLSIIVVILKIRSSN